MGLFSKGNCSLCGSKVGMLDKKIADGKICKECKKKLSVWFDDYKNSTGAMLKEQIEAKDRELENISQYHFSRIYGEMGVILIDTENRVFTAFGDTSSGLFGEPRKVTSIDDVLDLRPDIISFDQIKDIDIDILVTNREETRTVDGEQVSFDPPEFTYMCGFTLRIYLDHPYIEAVHVQLNKGTVQIRNVGYREYTTLGRKIAAHVLGLPNLDVENASAIYNNDSLMDYFYHSPYEMPKLSYGFRCSNRNWSDIQKYQYYLFMANEIENCLLGNR